MIKKRLNELNFSLEEQAQDLRIQLNHKVNEIQSLQEALGARNLETEKNEERLKKMKGLLIAANNKITEYKDQVSLHHQQLEESNSKTLLEIAEQEELKSKMIQKQSELDQLLAQMNDEKHEKSLNVDELNRQLRETSKTLESTRAEFQSYKAKAHAALLQNASLNLESQVQELQEDKLILEQKLIQKQSFIQELELKIKRLEESEELKIQECKRQGSLMDSFQKQILLLQQDLDSHESQLDKLNKDHSKTLENVKESFEFKIQESQLEHTQKESELHSTIQSQLQQLVSLDSKIDFLNSENQSLKSELNGIKLERETRPNSIWTGAGSPSIPIPIQEIHSKTIIDSPNGDVLNRSNTSTLLHSEPVMSSFKIKELLLKNEQLVQLLTDSESHVQKLMEQEKFLKEELKNEDRQVVRQNLNVEYLKNIVLSYFESGTNRDKLIPVVSKVLCLSYEEEKRLKSSLGGAFGFF